MKSSKSAYENEILIAGKDYPQLYIEFVTMFYDDRSCRYFSISCNVIMVLSLQNMKYRLSPGNKLTKDLFV